MNVKELLEDSNKFIDLTNKWLPQVRDIHDTAINFTENAASLLNAGDQEKADEQGQNAIRIGLLMKAIMHTASEMNSLTIKMGRTKGGIRL